MRLHVKRDVVAYLLPCDAVELTGRRCYRNQAVVPWPDVVGIGQVVVMMACGPIGHRSGARSILSWVGIDVHGNGMC